MKAGEYYILYRPDFKDEHTIRRLNVVFYSKLMQKRTEEERRMLDRMKMTVSSMEAKSSVSLIKDQSRMGLSKNRSGMSRRSHRHMPLDYDERIAVELMRLEFETFHDTFYKMMEEVEYERYLKAEKFKPAEFADDTDSDDERKRWDMGVATRRLVDRIASDSVPSIEAAQEKDKREIN